LLAQKKEGGRARSYAGRGKKKKKGERPLHRSRSKKKRSPAQKKKSRPLREEKGLSHTIKPLPKKKERRKNASAGRGEKW